MTNFNFIFDTICVPYIFRKSIFGWNCDHDTPLCDTPLLEDTPLCDTPDDLLLFHKCIKIKYKTVNMYGVFLWLVQSSSRWNTIHSHRNCHVQLLSVGSANSVTRSDRDNQYNMRIVYTSRPALCSKTILNITFFGNSEEEQTCNCWFQAEDQVLFVSSVSKCDICQTYMNARLSQDDLEQNFVMCPYQRKYT